MRELMKRMEEAKGKDPFAEIAKMVDRNDQGGAMLEGAKYLGFKKLADRVKLVMKLHSVEGHMPMSLVRYRGELFSEMMEAAKKKLSKDDYDAFVDAF